MAARCAALAPVLCILVLVGAPLAAQDEPHRDVPYVPTPTEVVEEMLKLGNIHAGDIHYDLGCGDGRIVIAAAKLGARGTGIDIDPQRIKEANENAKEAGVTGKVKFLEQNLFRCRYP